MNCFRCGEEREPAGYICKLCFDEVMANEWAKIEAIEQKKNGEIELSPREAIIAMLDGEVLDRGHKVVEKWDGKHFVYQIIGEKGWTPKPMDGEFVGLRRFSKQKKQPMDTFECLAWVNSAESQGWMVSCKAETDYKWSSWDIPQRFKYDGREERKDCVSYRRARVLPDKSVIDESTIQGFLKEV